LLHRVGAKWWLSRIMVTWGIVAAAFMFIQGPISFYILRFLLGVMEAGLFRGVILFLTYWVPARHLSRARYFYMGIALSGILGNPLSGSLLELNGVFGLRGIQWMFMVEGLLAVAVGIWAYFYLTDKPEQATWLPDDERQALVETVDAGGQRQGGRPRAEESAGCPRQQCKDPRDRGHQGCSEPQLLPGDGSHLGGQGERDTVNRNLQAEIDQREVPHPRGPAHLPWHG
jgi:hypothetical protein